MAERVQSVLSSELVARWIDIVRSGNVDYRLQIGQALDRGDPLAHEFIRRAYEKDPDFVTQYFYPDYDPSLIIPAPNLNSSLPLLGGILSGLRDRVPK